MPKQVDHENRRRSLVEASWDVIAREGLEGVTLRKVAESANCTTGRIVHYFSGREDLILSALKTAYEDSESRMSNIIAANTDPMSRLHEIALEALPLDSKRLREWRVWMVFWAAAVSNEELAIENTRRIKAWRNLLHQLISEPPKVSHNREAELAFEIASFIDGLGIQVCLASSPAELKRSRKLAIEAVKNHLATIMRQQD